MSTAALETTDTSAETTATTTTTTEQPAAESTTTTEQAASETTTTEAAAKDAAPVEYKLQLPANAVLDADAIEKTIATARESGFSPEQAQKALELANTLASAQHDALLASYQPGGAAWEKQLDGWKAETLADASLGATPEARTAAIQKGAQVIDRFAQANPTMGQPLKDFLNTSGFGEKIELVHFMVWIGKAASEGTVVAAPETPKAPKTVAQRMYPDLPP